MDATTHPHGTPETDHHDEHGHEHHELGFWRKYIFSTDHKVIGIQYGISGLLFLFFGFCLMMMMRWQLAYPGQALPVIGKALGYNFGPGSMPDGKMTPEFYNSLGAMHGTIMIFAGVVPLAFAAFGNFVVPLQIGAPDMTFPKVNAASYWAFVVGGIIMLVSFFVPGGAAKGGWTSYTPLGVIADKGPNFNPFFNGQTLWLLGFIFLITSSLLGAINFITTIIQLRAPGLTWMRLPFFVWAQFVTAFLLLLAFPPLEAAVVMQLMDRVASTSFFMPSGLVVSGQVLSAQCGPIANALLDFWHADEDGEYDNRGFRYRGHQFADGEGHYRLETIVPAVYPGRTRHIHVKVQPPGGRILTTQLYFPDEPENDRDGLFRRELVMRMSGGGEGAFDFVVAPA